MKRLFAPRTRRFGRLLLWGGGLLLVAWAGVMLFVHTLDAEIYRRVLERKLSSALGRQVTVGALSFDLSLRPTLSARDVRIANPTWASRPEFATASRAQARTDLVALWHGRVELHTVQLHGLDVLLERNAEGAGNWVLGVPRADDAPVDLPDFDAVSLSDARIGWRDSEGSIWQAQVQRAQATIRDNAPFQVRAQSIYRATPVDLTVTSDLSLQTALNGKPWHLVAEAASGDARLTLDVRVASVSSLEGAELKLDARGDRLAAWSPLLQRPLPAWGPYRVSGRVRSAPFGVQIDELRLSLDGLPMHPSRLEIDTGQAAFGANVDTRLTAQGKLGDAPLSLEASSAPLPQLMNRSGPLPVDMHAKLEGLELGAKGKIAMAPDVPDLDLAMTARGDVLGLMRALADTASRKPMPVELSARLTRTADRFALGGISGRMLGCNVAGDLTYTHSPRSAIGGAFTLGRLSIAQIPIPALGAGTQPSQAQARLELPAWLDQFETDLSLRVAAIDGLPVSARNIAARAQLSAGVLALQDARATLAEIDLRVRRAELRAGVLTVQDARATLVGSELTGDGSLRWSDGRPQIDANVRIAVLDPTRFGAGASQTSNAADAPLPLEALRALDGNLQLTIGRIATNQVPIHTLTARTRLQRGRLTVDPMTANIADLPVRARFNVDTTGHAWRIEGDARVARVDVAALLRALGRQARARGVMENVQLVLDTQGTTLRTLLAQMQLGMHSSALAVTGGTEKAPVSVKRADIEVAPGGPARIIVAGSALGTPMDLIVTGGPLVELLQPERAWPKVQFEMRTALRGEPLRIVATSGPLQRLVSMRGVPLTLQASLPGVQAVLDGTVDELTELERTPFNGRIEIASLARTGALFARAPLPDLALTASGRVLLGEGEISLEELNARAGKSDARGRLRVRWGGRPEFAADLSAKLLDTTQWTGTTTDAVAPLDQRIPVQSLLAQDAQLHLRAERLILPGYDLARAELSGSLDKGVLELSASATEGDLRGELRFDANQSIPGIAARLSLRDFETQTLYTAGADRTGAATPLLSVRTQLAGSGATLREMLATAQGEMLATAGAGTVPIGSEYGFERLAGNLLVTLVPGRKTNDFSQLECAAARFTIAGGVATSTDGIALRFKRLDILGGGAMNLTTGKILFGYRAVRRNWFSFSLLGLTSGFARVTGTIGRPTVELDPSGVFLQGAAAWATSGLSLLAGDLWRKLQSLRDPCARIAGGASSGSDPLDQLIRSLPPVQPPTFAPATP